MKDTIITLLECVLSLLILIAAVILYPIFTIIWLVTYPFRFVFQEIKESYKKWKRK